jgi:hypothetical protein
MYNNAKHTQGKLQRFISTVLQFPATRYARAQQRPCDVKRVTSFVSASASVSARPWDAAPLRKTYPCQNPATLTETVVFLPFWPLKHLTA